MIDALFAIVGIAIVVFAIRVLWNPPAKHKNFSYLDQQRTMRAFDRSDLLKWGFTKKRKGKTRRS